MLCSWDLPHPQLESQKESCLCWRHAGEPCAPPEGDPPQQAALWQPQLRRILKYSGDGAGPLLLNVQGSPWCIILPNAPVHQRLASKICEGYSQQLGRPSKEGLHLEGALQQPRHWLRLPCGDAPDPPAAPQAQPDCCCPALRMSRVLISIPVWCISMCLGRASYAWAQCV